MEKLIQSGQPSAFDLVWDVLVVGAGPSGLIASLALAVDSTQRVLLIDAGPDVGERHRDAMDSSEKPTERADYTMGVGGAGLYSDGKLCLSLEVGGGLKDELASGEKHRLLDTIASVFETLLDNGTLNFAPDGRVAVARSLAERAGLHFKFYDQFNRQGSSSRCATDE